MSVAMLPGSFDPPTFGHMNLIDRSLHLFDKLYVVVADNISKKSLFTASERVEILKLLLKDKENVQVVSYHGLMANFAKENNVDVMVRGVRAIDDFTFELEMAMNNKLLDPDLDVVFLPTEQRYLLYRSSSVKELAAFGEDISGLVPAIVVPMVMEKIKEN